VDKLTRREAVGITLAAGVSALSEAAPVQAQEAKRHFRDVHIYTPPPIPPGMPVSYMNFCATGSYDPANAVVSSQITDDGDAYYAKTVTQDTNAKTRKACDYETVLGTTLHAETGMELWATATVPNGGGSTTRSQPLDLKN
jgi:hypothetical protein